MLPTLLWTATGAVLHSTLWDEGANTTDGGHRLGTTQGACSSSLSWCTNPDPGLQQSNDHKCKGAGPTPCFSGLAQWQIDRIVEQHNKVRAHHGACPMTYSKEIEDWTVASTGFQNTCTNMKLEHNSNRYINGDYVGENLYGASGYSELQDFDPLSGIKAWYCNEEGCWDYATSSGSGTGHFTQVVWKESLEIGCGLCHVKPGSGWTNLYFMCNYRAGGNMGGAYASNVGAVGSTATGCAPTPSGSTPSGTTPSGSTPSGTTPSGSTPSGSTPSGSTPSGSTPSGSTPSGSTPSGSTPSGSTPSGSTPSGSTPSGSTPSGSTPSGSTPSGSTPSGSTPSGSTSSGTSSGSTPSGTTPSGSTPSGSTPSGSTPSGSTPSGSTPSGSTPSGSTPSGSTPSGSTTSGAAQNDSGSGTKPWVYVVAVLGALVGVGACAGLVLFAARRNKPKVTLSGFYNEMQMEDPPVRQNPRVDQPGMVI